jgi:hypothetical protein
MKLFRYLIPLFQKGKDGPQIMRSEDMNVLVNRINAFLLMQIREGSSNALFVGDNEVVLQIKRAGSSDAGTEAGGPERFRLKSVQANYLTCHTWDGAVEGATDIYVAKPYMLRESLPSPRTEAGTAYTLTYTTGIDSLNKYRLKTTGGVTETQLVSPVWVLNDEIYAVQADTGVLDLSGNPITRIMDLESRQWATIS